MVNLTIDRLPVSVKEGTTLMEAAESIGIHIPVSYTHLDVYKRQMMNRSAIPYRV